MGKELMVWIYGHLSDTILQESIHIVTYSLCIAVATHNDEWHYDARLFVQLL